MEWTDFLGGIIAFLFEMIAAVVSVIIAPIDLLINALVPQATTAVQAFFGFVNGMLATMMDFIDWFFFVLGITSATWSLIMLVTQALLLVFIVMFPVKLILSTFRGMKD